MDRQSSNRAIEQSSNRAIEQSSNRAIEQSSNYTHSVVNHVNHPIATGKYFPKKLLFLFLLFALGFNLYAESAFTLSLKNDIIISTLSAGVYFGAFFVHGTRTSSIQDKRDVNFLDRGLMFNYRTFDTFSTVFAPVLALLPAMVPLGLTQWNIRNDFCIWLTYGVMYFQAIGFTYGTRRAVGRLVARPRPKHYLTNVDGNVLRSNSFPSGTTAMAFMPATFLSVTFSAEFPNSPLRLPIIIGSHTLAAFAGAVRIHGGHHFLTDVLAGAAIGSFFGWLIPTLHRRPGSDDDKLSFHFSGNSAVISLRL